MSGYLNPTPTPVPTISETPDNGSTPDPIITSSPTPTPVPTPTIPYVPDPKVPGVKHINGKDLRLDSDSINLLMLGVDEKYSNVDSIFIVSISNSKKSIKVISVPRDAYVPYPENIASLLKSPRYYFKGIFKVNAAYHVGNNILNYQDGIFASKGINFLCSVLDGLLVNVNLTIHDYVRVNFEGFTEIVDIAGGVYVDVPEDMYNSNGKLFLAKGRQF